MKKHSIGPKLANGMKLTFKCCFKGPKTLKQLLKLQIRWVASCFIYKFIVYMERNIRITNTLTSNSLGLHLHSIKISQVKTLNQYQWILVLLLLEKRKKKKACKMIDLWRSIFSM